MKLENTVDEMIASPVESEHNLGIFLKDMNYSQKDAFIEAINESKIDFDDTIKSYVKYANQPFEYQKGLNMLNIFKKTDIPIVYTENANKYTRYLIGLNQELQLNKNKLLSSETNYLIAKVFSDDKFPGNDDDEALAFTLQLLMPKSLIIKACKLLTAPYVTEEFSMINFATISNNIIDYLSQIFNVPTHSVVTRLMQLNLINVNPLFNLK